MVPRPVLTLCGARRSAREALRSCLPNALRDRTFASVLAEDEGARRWLQQLLHALWDPGTQGRPPVSGAGGSVTSEVATATSGAMGHPQGHAQAQAAVAAQMQQMGAHGMFPPKQ